MARAISNSDTTLFTSSIKLSAGTVRPVAASRASSKKQSAMKAASGPIPTSSDVTGIELRLLPPFIIDNTTPRVWPLPGYAKLYCLVIVVSDVDNQLAGNIDLQGFQRIGDREHLPINKTIFYWQGKNGGEGAPSQIHTICQVMKSKKGLRDVGEMLSSLKSNTEYKSLLSQLTAAASKLNAITGIVTEMAGLVGKIFKDVEDKPLGAVVNSYTMLHGDFDKLGVTTLKYPTRNVDFNFDIVVRSASAENGIKAGASAKAASKKSAASKTGLDKDEVKVDMPTL